MPARTLTLLGIETSCDETAAAVIRGRPEGGRDFPPEILSNLVLSQIAQHRPYGGVVPEIAARAHIETLDSLIGEAIEAAGCGWDGLDGVAVTAGPGLIGGVMVGLVTGKAIAAARGLPLVAVNHLEGHALSVRLVEPVRFPYLLLLVSGGHCQLLAVRGVGNYVRLGGSLDDALGEAFDKVAKLLGLGYPGGPAVEQAARSGDPGRIALPRPMFGRPGCDFSFSGLKTAVRQVVARSGPLADQDRADIAAAFQASVTDIVLDRCRNAMALFRATQGGAMKNAGSNCDRISSDRLPTSPSKPADAATDKGHEGINGAQESQARLNRIAKRSDLARHTLVVAGGVAANQALRGALSDLCAREGFHLAAPPLHLCTDNAAMIAWAGLERLALGLTDPLDAPARARWPLGAGR